MRLPRGWHENQFKAIGHYGDGADRPIECLDCGWAGRESDLDETHRLYGLDFEPLHDRLTPGDPVPVGECPNLPKALSHSADSCRAFVYYTDVVIAYKKAQVHADACPRTKA